MKYNVLDAGKYGNTLDDAVQADYQHNIENPEDNELRDFSLPEIDLQLNVFNVNGMNTKFAWLSGQS